MKFMCPYCKTKMTRKRLPFTSWKAVNRHISYCKKNTNTVFCDELYGPISLDIINKHSTSYLKTIYPESTANFGRLRENKKISPLKWSKEELAYKAREFFLEFNRPPTSKDYMLSNNYPSKGAVYDNFNSWEEYLLFSDLEFKYKAYGYPTKALDNHVYRSTLEAVFVDKFLFDKYTYEIEPAYPEQYNKYYDWYICDLDVYIELSGGLRPEIITEKIEINKILNRKLLVVTSSTIYNYSSLLELLRE
jgi:hypothetical protein